MLSDSNFKVCDYQELKFNANPTAENCVRN